MVKAAKLPTPDRPAMPESYGLRPHAGRLPWTWASERLAAARNYWVVTTRPDGRPHAMPVWGVWLDEAFYFETDRQSRKGRNLVVRPDLVVHLESGDDVVILEGLAVEVTDVSILTRFADAFEEKYRWRPNPSDQARVVYALRPLVAYGWLERDFTASATRYRFGEDSPGE